MENKDMDFNRLGELMAKLKEKEEFLDVLERFLKSEKSESRFQLTVSYSTVPVGSVKYDAMKYISAIADLLCFDIIEIKNEIRGLYGE